MNGIKESMGKYDRTLVLILTAIGTIATIYLGVGRSINSLIEGTPVIQNLEKYKAVQEKINSTTIDSIKELKSDVTKDIKEVREDVKTILRIMKR